MKKTKGEVIICEFGNYIRERKKFSDAHPTATITEEIKSMFMGVVDIPTVPGFKFSQTQQQIPMVLCGIIYEEEVTENSNGLKIIS